MPKTTLRSSVRSAIRGAGETRRNLAAIRRARRATKRNVRKIAQKRAEKKFSSRTEGRSLNPLNPRPPLQVSERRIQESKLTKQFLKPKPRPVTEAVVGKFKGIKSKIEKKRFIRRKMVPLRKKMRNGSATQRDISQLDYYEAQLKKLK